MVADLIERYTRLLLQHPEVSAEQGFNGFMRTLSPEECRMAAENFPLMLEVGLAAKEASPLVKDVLAWKRRCT